MSVEENLDTLNALFEAFNGRDMDRYYEFHAESIVYDDPSRPEALKGRAALREYTQENLKVFPDLRYEAVRAFGQGDWVSAEVVATGTHKGPFPGPGGGMIPATNKPFRNRECLVLKFEGGQVVEERAYMDVLGFMAQLGLAP